MLRKILTVGLLTGACIGAVAQSAADDKYKPEIPGVPGMTKITPEAKAHAQEVADQIKKAFDSTYMPEVAKERQSGYIKDMTRQFDAIADQALAADRDKILEFMGIPKTSNTALYYFVSFSMPLPMLRSYALDAMWSGGTLVFRGSTPGKKINDFLIEDLRSLVYGKGAAANISIDPRLYDILAIKTVPTIAFVADKAILDCFDPIATSFKDSDMPEDATYDVCRAGNEKGYYKLSGAVTAKYALELFEEKGAKGVTPYKEALRKRGDSGGASKEQTMFSGKWEDVLTPQAKESISNAVPVPKQ